MMLATSLLALLPLLSHASPIAQPEYRIHESKALAARNLHKRTAASVDPNAIIPVKIALAQPGLEHGYDHLMAVSHPSSATYGQHLSLAEVNALFAPPAHAVDAVREWFAEAANIDVDKVLSSDNGWIVAHIPVKDAERAFKTTFYEHQDSQGNVRLGCDEYYLPEHIQEHVDYVVPGVKSSAKLLKRTVAPRRQPWSGPGRRPAHKPGHQPWQGPPPGAGSLPPDLQDCGRNITPTCIRALYGIPQAHLKDPLNKLGVFENGDIYAQSDIDAFFAQYAPNVPQGTAPIPAFIDGAQAPVAADDPSNTGESDIDLDIMFSLIYPQSVVLYQVDDLPQANATVNGLLLGFMDTFLDAIDGSFCTYNYEGLAGDSPGLDPVYPDPAPGGYKGQLQCGVYNLTRVLSISYGEAEYDLPERYQKRQCNEWMKLALQGHTVLEASGDYGVASYPGDDTDSGCLSGYGQNQTIFNPDFLSSCPYITSVGATQLYDNQTVLDPESSMQDVLGPGPLALFASHGGFSNHYPTANYQQAAVGEYFAKHDPGLPYYYANADASNIGQGGGVYNRGGRAFPDVSANGAKLRAYNGGVDYHFYGTSLAAPLWASVVTLINEERTVRGKGPVGFLNPVLYSNPWALNDITNGSNPNCGSKGFAAVPGWDPVTGLGTPNYERLLDLFLDLP